jgi:DNA-binding CsgD family transcriptional regulator
MGQPEKKGAPVKGTDPHPSVGRSDDRLSDDRPSDDKPSGVHRHLGKEESPDTGKTRKSWRILEEFSHEGYFYRLQRRPLEDNQQAPLAKREREVLKLASDGQTRKEIAEALGLAPSTVGVLLHRAAVKLGARSRDELILNYRLRIAQKREQ